MKNVGIYDPYLDSMSGGEKYMLTIASCISKNSRVTIFWDNPKIKELAQNKLHLDLSKIEFKPNIFSSKNNFYNKLLESRKYDYIVSLSDGSIPISLAKNNFIHFQFPVEWVNGENIKTKIKLLNVKKIICNSFFTKKYIDKKFNINSDVIYPPCIKNSDIVNFSDSALIRSKKNQILTVGRYSPISKNNSSKKTEFMINAFKKMIDSGLKNWKLIIAISYINENEKYIYDLEEAIKKYPIKIIKNAPFSELDDLYKSSEIYWHAAGFGENMLKYPERAEHFGITTVEAMAKCAVPVVYAAGGQVEVVDDSINGFTWHDEDEFIHKTKRIMIDNELREDMAKLGLNKAKKFTVEKFCEDFNKLIT